MKNEYGILSFLLLTIIIFSRCSITKSDLYGNWRNGLDTLTLNSNYKFLLEIKHLDINDTVKSNVDKKITTEIFLGDWHVSNKIIYLSFEDSLSDEKFGGCKSAQISKPFLSKMRLIRNHSCNNKIPAMPIFYYKVN